MASIPVALQDREQGECRGPFYGRVEGPMVHNYSKRLRLNSKCGAQPQALGYSRAWLVREGMKPQLPSWCGLNRTVSGSGRCRGWAAAWSSTAPRCGQRRSENSFPNCPRGLFLCLFLREDQSPLLLPERGEGTWSVTSDESCEQDFDILAYKSFPSSSGWSFNQC